MAAKFTGGKKRGKFSNFGGKIPIEKGEDIE
jgi:hypothetical protein